MADARPVVRRNVLAFTREFLGAFRVVVLNGPRQSGKSTLLRQLHSGPEGTGGSLFNLDDEAQRQAAIADPGAFVLSGEPFVYIDEVQRGGDALVRAVKTRVDDPSGTTTFVLAGSTNFLTVPTLSESLAGRAVLVEVWPFSQGERAGTHEGFLDRLVDEPHTLSGLACPQLDRRDYLRRVVEGGYPEAVALPEGRLRSTWFRSYVQTVTQRDIREFARVRQPAELPRLLTFLAGGTARELVKARLAGTVEIERNTLAGYLSLLDTVFLTRALPAWSRNPLGKVTRHAKLHVCDTGLAAHLHGLDVDALAQPVAPLRGQLVETFVHNEIVKQRTWSSHEVSLSHWRDRQGAEVDLIVETPRGEVFGIECKASLSVTAEDFRWLARLEAKLGDAFGHGVVFYMGTTPLSFGPKLTALPLSALWA